MSRNHHGLATIFRVPAVLFALSLVGLIGALLGDGVWDGLACLLIAPVVGVILWARFGARRPLK